ncbi:hypothetical protein GIB67_027309, partial [Kingdonia uniflora]
VGAVRVLLAKAWPRESVIQVVGGLAHWDFKGIEGVTGIGVGHSAMVVSVGGKIHTRRLSRLRLIDKKIKENEPSVSDRAPMDEGSNVEELDIVKNSPLAVVVPEIGPSSKSRRKAWVTKERDGEMEGEERRGHEEEAAGSVSAKKKQRLDRFMAKLELSKVGVILYAVGSGYTFRSKPREGFMAFRGQIWLRMQLLLQRLVKEDMDKELTEDELDEHARATVALMATLCGTDPDEAGRRMNKTMHQLAEKDKAMKEHRETFQGQFDKECETTVRLKMFIEALGYDPKTLKCFSTTNDPIAEDIIQIEGFKVDVAGIVVGGSVKEVAAGIVTDEVTDAAVWSPSTEGTGGIGIEELVGGDGVATPI